MSQTNNITLLPKSSGFQDLKNLANAIDINKLEEKKESTADVHASNSLSPLTPSVQPLDQKTCIPVLFEAIEHRTYPKAREILTRFPKSLNAQKSDTFETPLFFAVSRAQEDCNEDIEFIQFLLQQDTIEPSFQGSYISSKKDAQTNFDSPLLMAARKSSIITSLLIKDGRTSLFDMYHVIDNNKTAFELSVEFLSPKDPQKFKILEFSCCYFHDIPENNKPSMPKDKTIDEPFFPPDAKSNPLWLPKQFDKLFETMINAREIARKII